MNADLFRATTKHYMELRHITTQEQLRRHTTVGSCATWSKYWKDPDKMSMEVWEQIMKALNVPYDERFKMLREDK